MAAGAGAHNSGEYDPVRLEGFMSGRRSRTEQNALHTLCDVSKGVSFLFFLVHWLREK